MKTKNNTTTTKTTASSRRFVSPHPSLALAQQLPTALRWIAGVGLHAESKYPVALVIAELWNPVWKQPMWRVACPYCNETHTHGGSAGYRVSHCDAPHPGGHYYIQKNQTTGSTE